MGTREIAGTDRDATLPRTPITINGREYNLCFDLGALAEAETAINAEFVKAKLPERVNLLVAISNLNLANTRTMFAAAVRTFQPELGFKEARELLVLGDVFRVVSAIEAAWAASTRKPDRPPEPDAEPGEESASELPRGESITLSPA
jgi:hypothetical protein